jgi:hypothetical protein
VGPGASQKAASFPQEVKRARKSNGARASCGTLLSVFVEEASFVPLVRRRVLAGAADVADPERSEDWGMKWEKEGGKRQSPPCLRRFRAAETPSVASCGH